MAVIERPTTRTTNVSPKLVGLVLPRSSFANDVAASGFRIVVVIVIGIGIGIGIDSDPDIDIDSDPDTNPYGHQAAHDLVSDTWAPLY